MTGPQGMGPLRPMSKVVAVTIDQAPGQTDPTGENEIFFIVEFSEVVTGFGPSDVLISGTALATTASVSGVGSTYLVGISGMTVYGTVIIDIPSGVVTGVSGATNGPSVAIDNSVVWDPSLADVPIFLNVDSDTGTNGVDSSTIGATDGIEQAVVFGIGCVTRLNATEATGAWRTTDGYSGGSAGLDGFGGANGTGQVLQSFGTNSHIEIRQDFLSFYGGDTYGFGTSAADHSSSAAFYRCPPTWKIRQVASGSTGSTSLSATFANPVGVGSKVVVGIATLSGVTVSGGPVGGILDGSAADATHRTSRMTAYRIPNMPGEVTRSVTLSGSGGAMVMVEFAEDDSYTTNLRDAIRANANVIGYYPMNHTLGERERNCAPTVTLSDMTNINNYNTIYSSAASDGRKYAAHSGGGSNGDTITDNNELTPVGNGGLTIGFALKPTSLASLGAIWGKMTDASNFNKEWEIYLDTDGSLTARTVGGFATPPASARQRRTPAGMFTVGVWHYVIVRFGNDAADYPTIRIDGVDIAGTLSGSGSANGNTAQQLTYGHAYPNSASRALSAAGGQRFICGSNISDAACIVIEDAAFDDGWFVAPVSVTIEQGASQSDPVTDTIPVVFDVTFSEAVTGFTAANVVLSGTAVDSTTLPTVIDSGDHIHYTVQVNGMVGSGTIVATILAGAAISIATGAISSGSNSTDNSVTYNATPPTVVDAGASNSIVAGTTLVITTTQGMAVGDLISVEVAADNAGTNGASSISSCTDSAGNVYTLRQTQNRDPGNASDGITHGWFTAPCTNAMAAGNTITITFSASTTSKAALVHRIRPTNSNGTFPVSLMIFTGTTGATGTPSVTTSATKINDIVIGSVAREQNSAVTGDSDTSGGSWSTVLSETANTGSVLTSAQISSQTKVVTAAGTQTYNPTFTSGDIAVGVAIFRQVMG